jgi:DNA-binding transcriptional MocR family regulator
VLTALDLPVVEDAIYAFLRDGPEPLAVHAPERTVLVDSLSKRVAPGLTLGFVVPPAARRDAVAAVLRSGGWTPQAFALDAAVRLMAAGIVTRLEEGKRAAAAERQAMVAQRLAGFTIRADPAAYHCWWELPPPWRAETFVAAAARRGIAVTPAAAFAVGPAHAPNAVRLALAPPVPVLGAALDVLAGLARNPGGGDDGTE